MLSDERNSMRTIGRGFVADAPVGVVAVAAVAVVDLDDEADDSRKLKTPPRKFRLDPEPVS